MDTVVSWQPEKRLLVPLVQALGLKSGNSGEKRFFLTALKNSGRKRWATADVQKKQCGRLVLL